MGLLEKLQLWLGAGQKQVTVLVLGLDNSGKSSTLNALRAADPRAPKQTQPAPVAPTVAAQKDQFTSYGTTNSSKSSTLNALRAADPRAPKQTQPAPVAPTVAAQKDQFTSNGVSFTAWDVCGAARHRALWERHYRHADAVIFVVDAADALRLVVAREELELVVAHPDMCARRVPLLVLANKADRPHALAPNHLAAALCLERITDKPWHICATSAITGAGLQDGVAWLARQLRDQHLTKHQHA